MPYQFKIRAYGYLRQCFPEEPDDPRALLLRHCRVATPLPPYCVLEVTVDGPRLNISARCHANMTPPERPVRVELDALLPLLERFVRGPDPAPPELDAVSGGGCARCGDPAVFPLGRFFRCGCAAPAHAACVCDVGGCPGCGAGRRVDAASVAFEVDAQVAQFELGAAADRARWRALFAAHPCAWTFQTHNRAAPVDGAARVPAWPAELLPPGARCTHVCSVRW